MLIFAAQSWPGRKKVLRYVNNIKWAPMPATSCLRCKNLIWRREIVRAAAAGVRLNRRRVFFAAKRETLCYFIQHLLPLPRKSNRLQKAGAALIAMNYFCD